MTIGEDALAQAMRNIRGYERQGAQAKCAGVHLEGPFVSYKKRGAQKAENIRMPDLDLFYRMSELSGGKLKIITMAPELDGAIDLAKKLKGKKLVSFAHSAAEYDVAMQAFEAGFSNLTHTFNCMQPMLHRAPGPIAAAADTNDVTAELIDDALHVQPPMIRALFKLMGPERIILISDSIAACGMAEGVYPSPDGMKIRLANGRATVDGTDTLAGSVMPLFQGVRRIHLSLIHI